MIQNEPWSKRVWYVELLLVLLSFWIFTGNLPALIIGNIFFFILITIVSISLKIKESNTLIKPIISDNQTLDGTTSNCVAVHGVKYHVHSRSLKLDNKNIKNVSDIQGFDKLWHLKKLDLSHNQLTSMKGFESFLNLKILKLSYNQIQCLENIKNLQKLQKIFLDNNQLKEFYESFFPDNLKKIDIAKNPIERFSVYTTQLYNTIHFGPKKWFPKQELKRLKKQIKRMKRRANIEMFKADFARFLPILAIWAVITFLLALAINLAAWGVLNSSSFINIGYWECLITQGSWIFPLGGFGAIFFMVLYHED